MFLLGDTAATYLRLTSGSTGGIAELGVKRADTLTFGVGDHLLALLFQAGDEKPLGRSAFECDVPKSLLDGFDGWRLHSKYYRLFDFLGRDLGVNNRVIGVKVFPVY